MTVLQKRKFKKLFNRINFSIKSGKYFYDYEQSYLDFSDKGRIYFKDKKGGKYCLILERVLTGGNYAEPRIDMRLYSCNDEYFRIDYDNGELIYRSFKPNKGYITIGNIFINYINDFFSGFYHAYRTMEAIK